MIYNIFSFSDITLSSTIIMPRQSNVNHLQDVHTPKFWVLCTKTSSYSFPPSSTFLQMVPSSSSGTVSRNTLHHTTKPCIIIQDIKLCILKFTKFQLGVVVPFFHSFLQLSLPHLSLQHCPIMIHPPFHHTRHGTV